MLTIHLLHLLLLSSTFYYFLSPVQAVPNSENQPSLPTGTGTGTGTGAGTCRETCGSIPVRYPFGTGIGCGHPDFGRYIKCNSGRLQFSTSRGVYTVSSIDYQTQTLILSDPLMSTCNSMQNSGSFSLDSSSPFNIVSDDIFVLLGCSTTSPVYDPNQDLCDTTGSASHVCKGLYSCKGVTGIGLEPNNAPISTCCVYDPPTGLGSSRSAYTVLDLPKLQCSSYSCIYGFGEDDRDPMKWNYGISLQFNDSNYQKDASNCKDCESSGGFCGFNGLDESFACVCRNGINTTTNCYGQGYAWSETWRLKIEIKRRITFTGILVFWIAFFI
ncbi:uncharacterized protein LOC122075600 [Macadamia integrifolia]|uniref:uncharacterized protein LOC122075600 n=1 Tax=Macadamia integrifolia TaxID=60698 RepID=UPI001C4FEFEB|nr:uncharacterized protein LOC122075600 [Macadamia integrifolia]